MGESNYGTMYFGLIKKRPEQVVLSDGTEIQFVDNNARAFSVTPEGKWGLNTGAVFGEDYCFQVKRAGAEEYESYIDIWFEEGWGNFIEGTVYEEKYNQRQRYWWNDLAL